MRFHLVLHSEIKFDLADAALWYEEQGLGLGLEFIEEFNSLLKYINQYPAAFPVFKDGYRQVIMKRFPFIITYTLEESTIFISRLSHAKQHPSGKIRK